MQSLLFGTGALNVPVVLATGIVLLGTSQPATCQRACQRRGSARRVASALAGAQPAYAAGDAEQAEAEQGQGGWLGDGGGVGDLEVVGGESAQGGDGLHA